MNIEELNTQLEYLDETKSLIKQAIIDKGQSISENDTFRSFVQKINDIETGLDTNRVPIWFMYLNASITDTLERLLTTKHTLSFDINRNMKHLYLYRVDDFDDVIREEPQIGDYVYVSSIGLLKEISGVVEQNIPYFAFGQIDSMTSSDVYISGTFVTIDAILNDNFVNALKLSSDKIKAGETILGIQGKSTIVDTEENNSAATTTDMVGGKIAYVNGQQIIGTLDEINAPNNFPGNIANFQDYSSFEPNTYIVQIANPTGQNEQKVVIDPGAKLEGTISYSDMANQISNLDASNIKSGVSILGVNGSYSGIDTSDATATSNDIANGKTAYVNGQKITGSITGSTANPVIAGSSPTISDDGSNINVDRGYGKKFILNADQQIRSSISYSDMANLINLTADKIKSGVTILGIIGTYAGATMKEYASETAMNNDIANIQEGEVVKVVVTSGIAGDVDNPLTTTTTHYIKETTMKKLVKEEDTISPQEYEENVNLADDILGTE